MKIILGICPYVFDETYPAGMNRPINKRGFNLIQGPTPCLGLLYIASVLKNEGHRVSYFEGAFYSLYDLKDLIRKEIPDLVGFLITAPFWDLSKIAIREIKKSFPNLKIAVGGRHVDLIQKKILEECQEVDFACFGDGEIVFKNLCHCLKNNSDLNEVKGLIFREGNKIIRNQPEDFIQNLDEIPFPDYSLIEFKRYTPSIGHYLRLPNMTMISSRGCPYHCLFCTSDDTLRERSIFNIITEIEFLVKKYGLKDILFYDEDLTENKDRMDEFCSRLIEKKFDLTWSGNARSDNVANMDDKLLKKMKKSGCWKLLFGLESGVQKTLDTLRKEFTVKESRIAIEKTVKAGIRPYCTFIFATPGETYEEGLKTIEFALSLKGIEFAKFLIFTPFPGSEVYKEIEKYGRIVAPLSKMTTNKITFVPHSMTKEQVEKLYFHAIRRFYRRPQYILQRFFHIGSYDELCQNIRGFKAFALVKEEICKS